MKFTTQRLKPIIPNMNIRTNILERVLLKEKTYEIILSQTVPILPQFPDLY